jgi:hypothetical protein
MAGHLDTEQARELASKRKSPGRKPRAEEQEIKDALSNAKPLSEVLKKLAEAAEKREPWAVSLYLAYMWGKPKEKQEISGPGGGAIEHKVTGFDYDGFTAAFAAHFGGDGGDDAAVDGDREPVDTAQPDAEAGDLSDTADA